MGKQTMAACLLFLSAAAWAEGGCDALVGKYQIVNKLADSDLLQEVANYRKWPKSNLETPMSAKKAV